MVEGLLKVVGAVLILAGIAGGFVLYNQVDRQGYERAKAVLAEIPHNEIAKAEYESQRVQVMIGNIMAIASAFGGIATGLLFLGLARIIDVLSAIHWVLYEPVLVKQGINPRRGYVWQK